MTSIVQHVGLAVTNSATPAITVSSTTLHNQAVVMIAVEAGSTLYTGFTVSDNAGGGSSTWNAGVMLVSNGTTTVGYALCTDIKSGVTSVTITPSGGSGNLYGEVGFVEASGSLSAADKNGTITFTTGAADSQAVTASAGDVGTDDLVLAGISMASNGTVTLADPCTTGATWTSVGVNQNGSTSTPGQISTRVNVSSTTNIATWSGCSGCTGLSCAAVVSFKGATVTHIQNTLPQMNGGMRDLTGGMS